MAIRALIANLPIFLLAIQKAEWAARSLGVLEQGPVCLNEAVGKADAEQHDFEFAETEVDFEEGKQA